MNIIVVGGGPTSIFWSTILSTGGANIKLLIKPEGIRQFKRQPEIAWHHRGRSSVIWQGQDVQIIHNTCKIERNESFYILPAVQTCAITEVISSLVALLKDRLLGLIIPTNGLSGEQNAHIAWPHDSKIISATLTLPCKPDRKLAHRAHIMYSEGGIGLARYDDQPIFDRPRSRFDTRLTSILRNNYGLDVRCYDSWLSMKYTKAIWDILGNSVPAILGEDQLDKFYANRELCRLELRVIAEALELRSRLGAELVDLPGYALDKIKRLNRLATLETWLGWTGWPTYFYLKYVVPDILTTRSGKAPLIIDESQKDSYIENLHADLWGLAKSGRLNKHLDRLLRQSIDSKDRQELIGNPRRLLAECLR